MTRVLGLDFESTGLDTATARIIEVGAVVWDVEKRQPLHLMSAVINEDYLFPLSEDTKKVTGLYDDLLREFGVSLNKAFTKLHDLIIKHNISYIVAHNGENYDKPLLFNEVARLNFNGEKFFKTPWIDTRNDLPFDDEPDSRKLAHLALNYGFINPFQHRALFDVLTMLKVMGHFDFQKIVEYSKIPYIIVRAMVGYEDREKAKARRFSWEKIGDKVFQKSWVKKIKATDFDKEQAACDFQLVKIAE